MRQVIVGHTAGPWHNEPCGEMRPTERLIVAHLGKLPNGVEEIQTIGRIFDYAPEDEVMANARLIASAPELLEALQGAVNVINAWAELTPATRQLVADARAAIAKAEGKV